LASTLIDSRAHLWTRDKRLRAAAEKAGARLYPHVLAAH
ncbi:MAG: type II toxin-antitoxin system VapC family toxin, partial [Pannonibacter indicus]